MNYLKVAETIENFVEGHGDEWDWDNFITGTSFSDPYLRDVQRRMSGLGSEFPAHSRGYYCSPEGIEIMRAYILELREKAKETEGKPILHN